MLINSTTVLLLRRSTVQACIVVECGRTECRGGIPVSGSRGLIRIGPLVRLAAINGGAALCDAMSGRRGR